MSHYFNQIDLMLTNHEMPAEYSSVRSMVLCNDCEMKSTAKFHFVYHKCSFCKSYNTKVLKTFNEEEEASSEPSDDTDQS
jgi:RING finger/CHY zinc finger protein 1